MAKYGVSPAYQKSARLGVLRWGGDGTTRYNWQVDSSNAGFDWFFMGGDGNANPVPSASPDALVNADNATQSATLLTIPIIPYINNSAAWSCSFPEDGTATNQPVYGAQQSANPYVHPAGEQCGNSIEPAHRLAVQTRPPQPESVHGSDQQRQPHDSGAAREWDQPMVF